MAERLQSVVRLQQPATKSDEKRVKLMVKHKAENLAEEHGIKRRKLGAGAPAKIFKDLHVQFTKFIVVVYEVVYFVEIGCIRHIMFCSPPFVSILLQKIFVEEK